MNRSIRNKSKIIVVVLALIFAGAAELLHAAVVRTVALNTQHLPGTADGTIFYPAAPTLNAAGQTAFWALLNGSGVTTTNNEGIWSEGSGALELIARKGAQAPDTPDGVNYVDFFETNRFCPPCMTVRTPWLSDAGETAFRAQVVGSGVSYLGIWSGGSGTPELVARTGSQAPGTASGVLYGSLDWPLLNGAGQTAFLATLTGSGVNSTNARGIWSEGSGVLELVARTGDPAPGTPSGVNYSAISGLAFNDNGDAAFHANLTGSTNNEGIWSQRSGTLELVVRKGSPAPGMPSGVNFNNLYSPVINDAGQTAFRASFTVVPNSLYDQGIWSEGSGTLALVAREGDLAPGAPANRRFASFDDPIMNADGHVTFRASLLDSGGRTSGEGIWSDVHGYLDLVAGVGVPLPGASGTVFNEFSLPAMNSAGQIAFLASVPEGFGNINVGIWATDSNGILQLIVRKGDVLQVAPGDFRTISALGFVGNSGNDDGRPSGFNDKGQLAFVAAFTNGSSGVFVSNLVAVPEPSSLLLLLAMALVPAFGFRNRLRF
jgi:hypothetical protein